MRYYDNRISVFPKSSSLFAKTGSETSPPATAADDDDNNDQQLHARSIYSFPEMYDLAFGYRGYQQEVDFLVQVHTRVSGGSQPKHILELAAGPGRHAITALQEADWIESVDCIDLSPEMKEYAKNQTKAGLDEKQRSKFTYHLQDMRSFKLASTRSIDTAWILLGSLQHLTKNQDIIDCFQSIHKVLVPGGTVIIELPHPREVFSMVECTRNEWAVPLDEDDPDAGELEIIWGDDGDDFDPVQQVRQFTVSMRLKDGAKSISDDSESNIPSSVREVVPIRLFTAQELDALARCTGFSVIEMYGALDEEVGVDDGEEAYRLVCVLQKQ